MTLLCAALSVGAGAQQATFVDDDGEAADMPVHPTLPLYARDAMDPCVPGSLQIRITLANMYPEGIVKFDLYGADPDEFLERSGKLRRVRVEAKRSGQKVCIDVPEPGTYAVTSYHDLDADRDLDKKWNFKPKEPYGMSNNIEIKQLRLPKFEEAAFEVGMGGADIDLIYYGKKAGVIGGAERRDKSDKDSDGDDD